VFDLVLISVFSVKVKVKADKSRKARGGRGLKKTADFDGNVTRLEAKLNSLDD